MNSRFRLLLSLVFVVTILSASAQAQNLTVADIVAKHFEAIGGRAALAKLKSRVAAGTVQMENEPAANMAIMSEMPNRVSAVFVFEKYDLHMSFDGKESIVRPIPPRMFGPFVNKYQQMLASGLMFNSISLYNLLAAGEGAKLEAKGMKTIRDRQAYVVEMKTANGLSARLFFDAETFMWIRTEYGKVTIQKPMGQFTNDVVNRGQDDITADFYFETSDFREVDGVKLPFKFEQTLTTPYVQQKTVGKITGTITEYQHNIPIDPKMFQ